MLPKSRIGSSGTGNALKPSRLSVRFFPNSAASLRRAIAARRGRFRGLAYPSHPKIGKTRCSPIPERMTGQGRNAATAGWCGPQPGTGEDSGQSWRTLDAAAAARASRRGSRGGLLTPAPRRLAGESGRAEGSALCPSPQGAEQVAPKASLTRVASARPGARCRRPARRYGVDQAVVSPAAISITAMAAGRSRSNCSGLDDEAD